MEENTAIRSMETISNINFQLLVARKPFRVDTAKVDNDTDGDDDLLPDNGDSWKSAECLGGGQEDDVNDEEFSGEMVLRSKVHVDLTRARQMLARRDEIERARAPGRHKESETHMKNYPEFWKNVNNTHLQPIPPDKMNALASHPRSITLNWQQNIKKQ